MRLLGKYLNCFKTKNIKFHKYYSTKNEDLNKHKSNIMARGLPAKKPISGVKNIVLVSSGKGGVGKSTVSTNLAVALKLIKPEKNVGLLDADIFGPTIPLMMNLHETPLLNKNNLMEPLINYGIKCMSMGFLIKEGSPVIWRGLMVMQALEKLMRQVDWGPTDYLIIDTPPGTGDTHLSLVQNLPISGVILVTSPQSVALQVAKRGGVMYQKLNIPIVGIIENMSSVYCPSCKNKIDLFGEGTTKLAKELNCDILESFPLQQELSDSSDKGVPLVIGKPDCKESQLFKQVASNLHDFLQKQNK